MNNVNCADPRKRGSSESMGNPASFPLPDKMKKARTTAQSSSPTDGKVGVSIKSSDFFAAGVPGASRYQHQTKMFQVSASVLQSQRADHANSASIEAINQFAPAVAHGISKGMNSFSIGNNGAEYLILDIISAAPLPTYRQSYITATRTFLAHRNATIVPQLTKSFISE